MRLHRKLRRSFYLKPTLHVARNLLGKHLVRIDRGRKLVGKIVEVEAYRQGDPASHSFRGKTKRNEIMFGEGGYLYVYFTYGMHYCANVVTRPAGIADAVLIRAVEPVEGIEVMRKNRGTREHGKGKRKEGDMRINLCNGPAKLCQAYGIDGDHNRCDLLGNQIFILNGEKISKSRIEVSRRIGIRNGREKKWRFSVRGSEWVSRK